MNAYRLLDLAAKNMDPEDLSIVVALSEGKAVTLRCAIMASYAEQNLIDRIVGNLSVVVWIQQPVKTPIKLLLFKFLKETRVYQVWTRTNPHNWSKIYIFALPDSPFRHAWHRQCNIQGELALPSEDTHHTEGLYLTPGGIDWGTS